MENFKEEDIKKAAEAGTVLQNIQVIVWDYMETPMYLRNGVEMADKIYQLVHDSSFRAGEEEMRKTTKIKSVGKDELYCEFWKCLSCGNSNIPAGSKYCSDCGKIIQLQ